LSLLASFPLPYTPYLTDISTVPYIVARCSDYTPMTVVIS
jgi:hypothetical protein